MPVFTGERREKMNLKAMWRRFRKKEEIKVHSVKVSCLGGGFFLGSTNHGSKSYPIKINPEDASESELEEVMRQAKLKFREDTGCYHMVQYEFFREQMNGTPQMHTTVEEIAKLKVEEAKRATIHGVLRALALTLVCALVISVSLTEQNIAGVLIGSFFVVLFIAFTIWDVVSYHVFRERQGF